jgi:transposase
MKLHANAALSWSCRRLLAERVVVQGWTLAAAAEAAGVSVRCARKWVGRYRREGEDGLLSTVPRRRGMSRIGRRPIGPLSSCCCGSCG